MAKQKYWNGTTFEVIGTDASKVDISDVGGKFTSTDVEGALQENADQISGLSDKTVKIINNLIYVSKTGNDETGDGTQAKPFLTINKAISVYSLKTDTIMNLSLGDGTYNENIQINQFKYLDINSASTDKTKVIINGTITILGSCASVIQNITCNGVVVYSSILSMSNCNINGALMAEPSASISAYSININSTASGLITTTGTLRAENCIVNAGSYGLLSQRQGLLIASNITINSGSVARSVGGIIYRDGVFVA